MTEFMPQAPSAVSDRSHLYAFLTATDASATALERPKIKSPNLRVRSARIGKDPNAQSSGYTQYTLKLRAVFSGKPTVPAEYLNARVSAFRVKRAMI